MKTLFITHHYLTAKGGGSFASRAYINAFAELSSEMTLMYPVKDGENLFDEINPKICAIPVTYSALQEGYSCRSTAFASSRPVS